MPSQLFTNATLLLPDRVLVGELAVEHGRIAAVGERLSRAADAEIVDLRGQYLAPGFVELHVHGGDGADFMDGTPEAFRTVCRAHLRHGTTSLLPTSTAAAHDQILRFLRVCREFRGQPTGGARVVGAHFYGPYFAEAARGCHPAGPIHPPLPPEYADYLAFAECITTATIAPELPGAEAFARACADRGIRLNAGHSHATFAQVEASLDWGIRHVDHLFCAMSDRSKLKATQPYPMRGGLCEATLFFDQLTTEVIADGMHLAPEMLRLAYRVKGPDRLALVTDANRALDMPDGTYTFGPIEDGPPFLRALDVGLTPDRAGLASGVMGLDHALRVMLQATGAPLPEVLRTITRTPARIAGVEHECGSLEVGRLADLVVLDPALQVSDVYLGGVRHTGQ